MSIFVEHPCSCCSTLWSHISPSGGICCNLEEFTGVNGEHQLFYQPLWELQIFVRAESEGESQDTPEFSADV